MFPIPNVKSSKHSNVCRQTFEEKKKNGSVLPVLLVEKKVKYPDILGTGGIQPDLWPA
jgi:hypothetical protein